MQVLLCLEGASVKRSKWLANLYVNHKLFTYKKPPKSSKISGAKFYIAETLADTLFIIRVKEMSFVHIESQLQLFAA
jgi:hypothetical protein